MSREVGEPDMGSRTGAGQESGVPKRKGNMNASSPAHMRRSPSQQRSRERVERILDAAAAIVVDEGVDNLKVSDIAKRAGVPLGTLYQFFARKDDIIFALTQRFADRFESVLEAMMIYVCWEASQALLETAFRADPKGDPAIIEQTKVMARRYLSPAFEPGT